MVAKSQFFLKGKYGAKLEFSRRVGGGGDKTRKPSMGGVIGYYLEQHNPVSVLLQLSTLFGIFILKKLFLSSNKNKRYFKRDNKSRKNDLLRLVHCVCAAMFVLVELYRLRLKTRVSMKLTFQINICSSQFHLCPGLGYLTYFHNTSYLTELGVFW